MVVNSRQEFVWDSWLESGFLVGVGDFRVGWGFPAGIWDSGWGSIRLGYRVEAGLRFQVEVGLRFQVWRMLVSQLARPTHNHIIMFVTVQVVFMDIEYQYSYMVLNHYVYEHIRCLGAHYIVVLYFVKF